jgi:hypothetical protein
LLPALNQVRSANLFLSIMWFVWTCRLRALTL